MILSIRTDKPEAEIGLYDGSTQLAYKTWQAHRQLAETIHEKIRTLLDEQQKSLQDLAGIAVYQGPGSFTGLRIGMSVANALAYSLHIPIATATSDDWIAKALESIQKHPTKKPVTPKYGSPVHITRPKK